MATQEVAPSSVQNRNPPAAARSGTDEPSPLPSEVARRPGKVHCLPYLFPFAAWTAPVAVGQDHLHRLLVTYNRTADGAPVSLPAREQRKENQCPGLSEPSRWR